MGEGPALIGAVLAGAAAAGVALLDVLRLDRRFPAVDVAAWRPFSTAATLVGAALLGLRSRPAATLVGTVGLAAAGAMAGRAIPRRALEPGPDDVTILLVNALKGQADTGELATLIERETPDFVVLPEAGADFCAKLLPLVDVLGYRAWASADTTDQWAVALLAGERAGDLQVRSASAMRLRHVEATGGILGDRTLYAVHTTAPMGPVRTQRWLDDLAQIARWSRHPVAPLVVGDLNATLDHSALRTAMGGCRSAAHGTGRGLVGTYPASLPRWFGIQIDHVLVPAGTATTRFEVIDVAGTDHRGVLTSVRLPNP